VTEYQPADLIAAIKELAAANLAIPRDQARIDAARQAYRAVLAS
jgi:hypothetical protein